MLDILFCSAGIFSCFNNVCTFMVYLYTGIEGIHSCDAWNAQSSTHLSAKISTAHTIATSCISRTCNESVRRIVLDEFYNLGACLIKLFGEIVISANNGANNLSTFAIFFSKSLRNTICAIMNTCLLYTSPSPRD